MGKGFSRRPGGFSQAGILDVFQENLTMNGAIRPVRTALAACEYSGFADCCQIRFSAESSHFTAVILEYQGGFGSVSDLQAAAKAAGASVFPNRRAFRQSLTSAEKFHMISVSNFPRRRFHAGHHQDDRGAGGGFHRHGGPGAPRPPLCQGGGAGAGAGRDG